ESAVVGKLLKRFGEALEAFAIVYGLRGLEEALPAGCLPRVLDRLYRGAAGEGEPAIGVLDALRREPMKRDVGCRDGNRHGDAAAAHGGKQAGRTVRDQDEDGAERRLLQALEERVGGV